MNDPELSLVINYFEGVTKPKSMLPSLFKRFEPQLHLYDGILLYYHRGQKLFVVPTDMKSEMLELAHSQILSGHQGRYKTHQGLLQSCWWPSMFKDICLHIDQSKICVMTKPDNRQKRNLGKRPFPTKPNEVVSIDFIVDLEKSVKGNIRILTMVVNFSKFIEVYALKDSTAITGSRFVYDYCLVYGIPEKNLLRSKSSFRSKFIYSINETVRD